MSTEDYITLITAVVAIANVITALTPTKTDNRYLNLILKVLNTVSLNVGRNKNADDYLSVDVRFED